MAAIGAESARESVRLFMVPGMTHCQATDDSNADSHDRMVSELEMWIQSKKAPDRIIASSFKDGKAVRTRPISVPPGRHLQGNREHGRCPKFHMQGAVIWNSLRPLIHTGVLGAKNLNSETFRDRIIPRKHK